MTYPLETEKTSTTSRFEAMQNVLEDAISRVENQAERLIARLGDLVEPVETTQEPTEAPERPSVHVLAVMENQRRRLITVGESLTSVIDRLVM